MKKQLGCILILATSVFAADEVKSWLEGLELKALLLQDILVQMG
ncbi:hypothetical protein [Helicobacter japonicus]|nr:hypothetical protein [Helicobacter japonicus]